MEVGQQVELGWLGVPPPSLAPNRGQGIGPLQAPAQVRWAKDTREDGDTHTHTHTHTQSDSPGWGPGVHSANLPPSLG